MPKPTEVQWAQEGTREQGGIEVHTDKPRAAQIEAIGKHVESEVKKTLKANPNYLDHNPLVLTIRLS